MSIREPVHSLVPGMIHGSEMLVKGKPCKLDFSRSGRACSGRNWRAIRPCTRARSPLVIASPEPPPPLSPRAGLRAGFYALPPAAAPLVRFCYRRIQAEVTRVGPLVPANPLFPIARPLPPFVTRSLSSVLAEREPRDSPSMSVINLTR